MEGNVIKNKKLLKKMMATGTLLVMTAPPTIVYASSYSSSLQFDTTLRGQTRYSQDNGLMLEVENNYFAFSKANHGITVNADSGNVQMYN